MERYNDDELIYLMRCGSQEAQRCLYDYYYQQAAKWILPFARYHLSGYDFDDYLQIAMLNFDQIIDYYRDDQQASFMTFMRHAVIKRLSSVSRSYKKTEMLGQQNSVSLSDYIGDDQKTYYEEMIEDPRQSYRPDIISSIKETETYYHNQAKSSISQLEQDVIKYIQMGYEKKEIAQKLDISIKSVYNAAYRYHKKMQAIDE